MLAPRATLINMAAVIDQVLLGDAPLNNLREVKRAIGAIHDILPQDRDINRDDYLEYVSVNQAQLAEAQGDIDGKL